MDLGLGITLNALLPGYMKTERLAELGVSDERMASQIPSGRLGIACDDGWMRGI